MKFILATTNKNKLSEINAIAKDYGINFELPQVPFEVDENGETLYENALKKAQKCVELQSGYQENILKKAKFCPKENISFSEPNLFYLQENALIGHSQLNTSESIKMNNLLECNSELETVKDYDKQNNLKLKKQNSCYILSDDTGLFVEALNGAPGIHSARYDTTPEKRIQKLLNALKNKNNKNAKFLCTMVLLTSKGKVLTTNTGEIKGIISNKTKGINGFGYDPIFFIESLNKTMAQLSKEEKNTISHRAKALIPILKYIKTFIL